MPAEAPEGQAAVATVDLSSDDSGRGEEEDEEDEEERDSEVTIEGMGETYPWRRSSALRSMLDDNDTGTRRGGEDPPLVPKKDRSGLLSRGSTPALVLPEASSSPSGAPSSAAGPPEADPRRRLSGFKLGRRPLEPATANQ